MCLDCFIDLNRRQTPPETCYLRKYFKCDCPADYKHNKRPDMIFSQRALDAWTSSRNLKSLSMDKVNGMLKAPNGESAPPMGHPDYPPRAEIKRELKMWIAPKETEDFRRPPSAQERKRARSPISLRSNRSASPRRYTPWREDNRFRDDYGQSSSWYNQSCYQEQGARSRSTSARKRSRSPRNRPEIVTLTLELSLIHI